LKTRWFIAHQYFPRVREELFPFFADVANLELITPPWLAFRVLTPLPIEVGPGSLIDYRLKLHGFPIRWRTRISAWDPPSRFTDEQLSGPYRLWRHEHLFETRDEGTWMTDRVAYSHFGGPLIERRLVRPDVEKIFAWRSQELARLFGEDTSVEQVEEDAGIGAEDSRSR